MEHPSRDQLKAFLWGQLDEADHEGISLHVDGCDSCCQTLREIPDDAFVKRLRGADTPTPPVEREPAASLKRDHAVPQELIEHPRYKIGRFLGAGGMGLVYQAEHRLMDRQVALKIIHRDLMCRPRIVERFRLEVKAAARLSHPNIVTAFDAEQAGDVHFLVMEFVDGMSLDRIVRKQGPLELSHACNFIRQAARGLQHAFEIGMVHRDIKPHNLMLNRKCQVKILDFGLARLASETRAELELPSSPERPGLTSLGDVMGTPDFMAPEQATDSRQTDIRADIYSLGCTLYYLLVGHAPFSRGTTRTKLFSQKFLKPQAIAEQRADVPQELQSIFDKMMAKEASDRFQTPAEVVKALNPYVKAGSPRSLPEKTGAAQVNFESRSEVPSVNVPSQRHAKGFLARCPFCRTNLRIPDKALGASIRCPQCSSYFTAVPEGDGFAAQ